MSPKIVEEESEMEPPKKCKRPDQVWNEITNRWVKKDGVIGKRIEKRIQEKKNAKKDKDRKDRKEMKDRKKRNEMKDMKTMMDEAKRVQDALESEVKRLKTLVDDVPLVSTGLSLDFSSMLVCPERCPSKKAMLHRSLQQLTRPKVSAFVRCVFVLLLGAFLCFYSVRFCAFTRCVFVHLLGEFLWIYSVRFCAFTRCVCSLLLGAFLCFLTQVCYEQMTTTKMPRLLH
jgi:hypothetical protein